MRPLWGLIVGLLVSLFFAALAGENPFHVLNVMVSSAFGSSYDLGLSLFYTTSLIFTGLSVAVAFHCGLFNIGAEGQLTIGALVTAAFAAAFPQLPFPLAPLLALFFGVLAGALWGFIPGFLKAHRGSHEVIVTMMMNFIAAGIASYVVLEWIKNPDSQNPESAPISSSYRFVEYDWIQKLFPDSPANISLVVALLASLGLYLFLYKRVSGFELRVSGKNEVAAEYSGIQGKKLKVLAMSLAGALAALVALNEILGSAGKFRIGFSPDYGFIGIAVALLARNHPLGIILSAFLFGVLQKGASDLDLETDHITRDFARIVQATLIFSVAAFSYIPLWKRRSKHD